MSGRTLLSFLMLFHCFFFLSFHPPPLLPSPHPLSSLDLSLVSLSFIQRESLKLRYDSWDTSEGSCTPTFCCFTSSFQLFLLPFLISLTFDIYIPSSSSITEQLALSLHRPISLPAEGCVGRRIRQKPSTNFSIQH